MKKQNFWGRLGPRLPRYYVQTMAVVVLCACMVTPAFALDDMWTVANRIIVDVYGKIAGVSTVLAGLMSAVAVVGAGLRPARPIPGRNSSPTLSRNKTGTHPNRIRPNRKPAASVKRQGRNAHPAVRELAPAVHSVQTGPAGKRWCNPVLPKAVALAALVQKLIRSVVAALLEVSLAAHPRLWFQWHILQNHSENGNIPVQYSRNTQYPETTRLRPAAE